MRYRMIVILICITAISRASWVCPVYDVDAMIQGTSSESLASLESWSAEIIPVPVENSTIADYAKWDYAVREEIVLLPPENGSSVGVCLDLGVVPYETRKLTSFRVNGVEIDCQEMLGQYPIPMDEDITVLSENSTVSSYIQRHDWDTGCIRFHALEPEEEYRAYFESEEDFRSAVPETARFYCSLWNIQNREESINIEVEYTVMGWTYITGAEPLHFSLCQPLSWRGPAGECELVFRLPAGENSDEWNVECVGCYEVLLEKPDENTWRLELTGLDIEDIAAVPVFVVHQNRSE